MITDTDGIYIPSQNGIKPNATTITHHHISHRGSGRPRTDGPSWSGVGPPTCSLLGIPRGTECTVWHEPTPTGTYPHKGSGRAASGQEGSGQSRTSRIRWRLRRCATA